MDQDEGRGGVHHDSKVQIDWGEYQVEKNQGDEEEGGGGEGFLVSIQIWSEEICEYLFALIGMCQRRSWPRSK